VVRSVKQRLSRYQLTAIGGAAPELHVAEEIADNRFRLAGGKAGMKVYWQVRGIRSDAVTGGPKPTRWWLRKTSPRRNGDATYNPNRRRTKRLAGVARDQQENLISENSVKAKFAEFPFHALR